MPGHLCSLVPGQRAAKLRWQCRDRPGDGIANRFSPMTGKRRPVLHARDGAVAFHSGKMQQHCEPRGAFHQSADRRSAQADDQVTFPVSGYGPISCFRRSFTDHDLRRDEGFAPPAATCPRHAQCPSRAKAGGQLTTECAAALYVERLIDRLMTDPHRLIFGPVPRIVDPKTVRDLLRTPGPGPSPVLPRPMPTTVPDDAWPLDHRSIRCRDPTRKPILHIAPQRLIRCQPWLASAFWRIDQYATAPSLLGSPGHRFGSPRCAAPRGRSSTVLAPAGKQYDVCLFPGRAEEQSPHVPRKTGNVLTAAWPIAINVMVACRPTSGTTSSLPEGIHRHLGPRPRSNAPSQSLPRTEQAPHAVPSPVDLANATCSVQTGPTAVCVPS